MTRRAPPLDTQARRDSTGRVVHRVNRWAVWLLLTGAAATLGGCRVLPDYQFVRTLPLSRSSQPVDVLSADGMVSRAARVRLSRKLAATGDTELLDYHLGAMRDIGAPPLLADNKVELLVDGPRTYRAMFSAIERAREFVLLESFIFEEAIEGDHTLSQVLVAAARRGVRIYVLYDAVGSLSIEKEFEEKLKGAGVALCVFNPLNPLDTRFSSLNQRDHRKIVVIDSDIAFAGGINFSRAYQLTSKQARRSGFSQQESLDKAWRDTHISIRGTGVAEMDRLFRETWTTAKCEAPIEVPPVKAVDAGDTLVQIVASTPDDELNVLYLTLLSVIEYAQKSVDITMAYFVPDDVLEKAIMDAARRGVKVRIILPSYSDFSGVFYAGRAHYNELLEAGVELYELEDAFLHSKSIVVDGVWSSIGSTNFDWRSFVHNNEISVCVIDTAFARTMAVTFDDDLRASKQITLEAWRKRGLKERLKELMWLPIQYWL